MAQQFLSIGVVMLALSSGSCVQPFCQRSCTCSVVDRNWLSAMCRPHRLQQLAFDITTPRRIISLSVASNNISSIPDNAFLNFTELRYLNLSQNHITKWDGDIAGQLASLSTIDITGNDDLVLPASVLSLPALRAIYGVRLSNDCGSCSLVKNYTVTQLQYINRINLKTTDLKKGEYLVGESSHCRKTKHQITDTTVYFAKYDFFPTCLLQNKTCFDSQVKRTPVHLCWEIDNNILNAEYAISLAGLVLNFTVVYVTLSMKLLRGNVTLLLVANMAASDFLISLYAVTLTSIRKVPYSGFLKIFTPACSVLGFIWLTSQFVSIASSVLVTIERFLAIVLCQKPRFRMTIKTARHAIVATWVCGIAVGMLPLLGIGAYNGNTFCVPIDPSKKHIHSFQFSITITLFAIILYIATIPLYIKIFLFVKANQMQRGVKKEGVLAKKIAALVLSNMVFFFLPVFCAVLLLLAPGMFKDFSMVAMGIITATLPAILTSINAMCNPLLYAFRHSKFIRALKICLRLEQDVTKSRELREHSSSVGALTQSQNTRKYAACTL